MRGMIWRAAAGALAVTVIAVSGCGPKYPNCNEDDDCHEGELCVNGTCQQCREDSDCPSGQQCVGGRCDAIEGFCQSNADCPPGQECRNDRCVAPAVTSTEIPDRPPPPSGPTCDFDPVLFGFDAEELSQPARDAIASNANCIRTRSIGHIHLTGYADPRGTEEYNLALGDRRARSVQRYLQSLGISATVTVSSMGEEMATGTSEPGWAHDRRVDFIPR